MTNKDSQKSLVNLFKWAISGTFAAVALTIIIVSLINLMKGQFRSLIIVLLISGIIILWFSFFYIYRSAVKPKVIVNEVPDNEIELSLRQIKVRTVIPYMIVVLTIATIPFFYNHIQPPPYRNPNEPPYTILMVTDIQGQSSNSVAVTETIIRQLQSVAREYPTVLVLSLPKAIAAAQESSEAARAIGQKYHGSIVLWGSYTVTGDTVLLNIHFEVLEKSVPSPLRQIQEGFNLQDSELNSFNDILNIPISGFEDFGSQTQAFSRMSYLTLLTIGLARLEAQDYDGAIERFNDAIRQHATTDQSLTSNLYKYLALAHFYKGEYELAISDFSQAIKLKPEDARNYVYRGYVYYLMGEYNRAIADQERAIQLKPDYVTAFLNRGNIDYSMGLYDRAIVSYIEATKLDPKNVNAYKSLGILYAAKTDYEQAITYLLKVLELDSQNADAYYLLGTIYSKKGDYDRSIANSTIAIKLKGDYVEAYNNRAKAYVAKGDKERAIADFRRVLQLTDDPNLRREALLYLQGRAFDPQKDCGLWQSKFSGKRYTLICQSMDSFELYENDPKQGLIKVGTGTFKQERVEADMIVIGKNRRAHLELTLSNDGKELKGSFHGEDPIETGSVIFQKVE